MMVAYADPEILVGEWLQQHLDLKFWFDPKPPGNQPFTSGLAHWQRSPGSTDTPLTIDDVLFDCDVYAANADHARNAQNAIWNAVMFVLPRVTFPNGVFVKSTGCPTPPWWAPDPKVNRRAATYRVILHGVV